MQSSRQILEQLLERQNLSEAQAAALLGFLTDPEMQPPLAGAILAALRVKGVTAAEVRGFAGAMRARARKLDLPTSPDAIDIVGTGGDASGSLNLSTGAALLTAACGMPVIKHGNRSISSRSGSADFIEHLGLALPLDTAAAVRCFNRHGFHVPVCAVLPSGNAQRGAHPHGTRRTDYFQFAGSLDQSGRAAFPIARRL
jgi:anthranilate phosphoribosyltransferase